jgi:peptidoglycan/xylan/chitin deacetylase (PgdA/CDA1 family)
VIFLRRLALCCALAFSGIPVGFAQPNPAPAAAAEPVRAQPAPAEPVNTAPAPAPAATAPAGPQITFNSVHVDGPFIAITFDDGPHGTLTPKLLDMLAARKVKATFFVVGQMVAEYPDIMRRIARDGHEVASHSWSHPNLAKMSDEAVRGQLQRTSDAIKAAIGTTPTLMRPPYGSITPRQKSWMFQEFGYRTIIWDVDPFDWKRPGPGVVTQRIVNQTQNGSIILAHDIHAQTIEAMPSTLDQLLQKGFKFVTVSELLAMAKPGPRPTIAKPAAPAAEQPPVAADRPAASPKPARRQQRAGSPSAAPAAPEPAASPAPSAPQPNG